MVKYFPKNYIPRGFSKAEEFEALLEDI